MDLQNIAIKELLNNIGCLEALRALNVNGFPNLKKFHEIQRNMGSLHFLYISGNANRFGCEWKPYSLHTYWQHSTF